MIARIQLIRGEVAVDLSSPVSLARPIDFSGREPRHFGAPPPRSLPFAAPGFSGTVATGASCNCSTITLTPHGNGTHTECVGHLTREPLDAYRVVPCGLLPALVLSVEPVDASASDESTTPPPKARDQLVTRGALERQWLLKGPLAPYPSGPFEPRAAVIRTSSDPTDSRQTPPYLSREAAQLLVERGIEHLVVDLPSVDRAQDEGRLTAHRIFFGLPPEGRSITQARRPDATITELAYVPEEIVDGWYLLELQVPALGGDAVPSRPLIYALQES